LFPFLAFSFFNFEVFCFAKYVGDPQNFVFCFAKWWWESKMPWKMNKLQPSSSTNIGEDLKWKFQYLFIFLHFSLIYASELLFKIWILRYNLLFLTPLFLSSLLNTFFKKGYDIWRACREWANHGCVFSLIFFSPLKEAFLFHEIDVGEFMFCFVLGLQNVFSTTLLW